LPFPSWGVPRRIRSVVRQGGLPCYAEKGEDEVLFGYSDPPKGLVIKYQDE